MQPFLLALSHLVCETGRHFMDREAGEPGLREAPNPPGSHGVGAAGPGPGSPRGPSHAPGSMGCDLDLRICGGRGGGGGVIWKRRKSRNAISEKRKEKPVRRQGQKKEVIARGAGTGRPATQRPWALGVALPALPPCTPRPGLGSQLSMVGGAGRRYHPFLGSHPPRRLSRTGSPDATGGLSEGREALQSSFVLNLNHHADPGLRSGHHGPAPTLTSNQASGGPVSRVESCLPKIHMPEP